MTVDRPTSTLSLERHAPDARALVVAAQGLADEQGHVEVQPLHLLLVGLIRDPGVAEVFRRAVGDVPALVERAEVALRRQPRSDQPAYLSATLLDLLERAEREAQRDRAPLVGVAHLLNALSQEIRGPAGELLAAAGLGPGALRPHVSALDSVPRPSARSASAGVQGLTLDVTQQAREGRTERVIGRSRELRRLITILERRHKCHPLLVGEPGVGKSAIVSELAHRLAVGDVPTNWASAQLLELDPAALAAGTRLRSEQEQRLRKLLDELNRSGKETLLVLRQLDVFIGSASGASSIGDPLFSAMTHGPIRVLALATPDEQRRLEERAPHASRLFTHLEIAESTVDETIEILRGVSLKFEEHHGVEISDGALLAAARLAKRYLQERFLPDSALGLLDEAGARKRVEIDGMPAETDDALRRVEALESQLQSLRGTEDLATRETRQRLEAELARLRPSVAGEREALAVRRGAVATLRGLRRELDGAEGARDAAKSAGDFARLGELEHVTLPELRQRYEQADRDARAAGVVQAPPELTEQDVAETLAEWTLVPVTRMLEEEAEKLLQMEERLAARVVGQQEAVSALARAVRRSRVGLRDPQRPIGSFLFLGPSGVGKTELAKALAEFLFDDEQALTRLDMSEFMERHMAQRLIGAPPGYADSERGGFLTEAVRKRPYSVLLFDEVEKAHQDVFNLLLQLLDDGRLTDGRGRSVDFSNTVVIMTSNIGSSRILDTSASVLDSEEGRDALKEVLLDELARFFRPELLNRIDDVCVFRSLGKEQLAGIVRIQLRGLQRLLDHRGLTLQVSDPAQQRLVELGYEPALGARPLKRAILRELQDPLAERLLAGEFEGATQVVVDLDGDVLRLESRRTP